MWREIIKELYYRFIESGKPGKFEDFGLSMYYQGFMDALKLRSELAKLEK